MTVIEALNTTKALLESVEVPVRLIEKVGDPIRNACNNITAVVEALKKVEAEHEANDKQGEDVPS